MTSDLNFNDPPYLITMAEMKFHSRLGVLAAEKEHGQIIVVDLELSCFYPLAIETDQLGQTVNYAEVFSYVKSMVETTASDLIEHLAGEIASGIFVRFPLVAALSLTIKKPKAPIEGDFGYMAFTLTASREEALAKTVSDSVPAAADRLRHTVIISLGSNIGDRQSHLAYALTRLQAVPGLRLDRLSSLYETEPWGNTEQAEYLNAIAGFKTSLEPVSILDLCQAIESERGRVREIRWGPRTLDLDLISYDQLAMETERLILPHPRYQEREFVTIPLAEINGAGQRETEAVKLVKSRWYPL